MAYIKQKSERKFKITVCNGYKVNGQKRMKAQTITVPPEVPKRGIQQYVMAEAERIEKKFKYGVEESDQTHFDRYAEAWLNRQKPYFKATTLAGYKRNLEIAYLQRRARLSTAVLMRRSSWPLTGSAGFAISGRYKVPQWGDTYSKGIISAIVLQTQLLFLYNSAYQPLQIAQKRLLQR